jgi:hypothetical protein
MKKLSLLLTALAGTCLMSYGQVGTFPGCPGAFGPTKLILGSTRTDTTSVIRNPGGKVFWVNDTIYIVKRIVRVAPNTTLELEQGTIVMGFPGPLDTSAIHIKQGAKLNALGDVNNPVVMTSCKIQGARNRGDWGGLVICGNSVNNLGTNLTLEGGYGATHGGTNLEDNSGTIQYLRVEFAGFAFAANQELNGITLGSVGVRTAFRNVQVSNANDDSFEWFGGNVNGRFLIANKGLDDDFDTDNGYVGWLQFGVALRENTTADFSGSNSFESDNEAAGDGAGPVLTPKTAPIISNFTTYGPLAKKGSPYNKFFKTGALLRRNTELDIYNSVFAGWPGDTTVNDGVQTGKETGGLYIQNTNAANNAISGAIRAKKNVVTQHSTYAQSPATDNVGFFDAKAWFLTPAFFNTHTTAFGTYMPFGFANPVPEFRLAATSPLISGSSFAAGTPGGPLNADLPMGTNMFSSNPALRGFSNVAYRGANDQTTEWAEPWAEYNPNLFKYTAGVVPTRKGATENFLAGNGVEAANSILIFPNPAVLSTEVKFLVENGTTDASMTVLDITGNVVHTQSVMGGVNEI